MDDDLGLRHRSGQMRAGPPHAALSGLRPAPAALGAGRERTVREVGGALLTAHPDRARYTGCDVTHVVLDGGLLPRRPTPPA
jgi:hypothetical protein